MVSPLIVCSFSCRASVGQLLCIVLNVGEVWYLADVFYVSCFDLVKVFAFHSLTIDDSGIHVFLFVLFYDSVLVVVLLVLFDDLVLAVFLSLSPDYLESAVFLGVLLADLILGVVPQYSGTYRVRATLLLLL